MKPIAFYLPQFHRIPENDKWWGEGFTEWTNTRKSQPLFHGHFQPREPHDGNYYNLLEADTREWQARIAREHGIHGFCYYHYWFDGKLLLEKPFELVLESKKPDFPFCLCWANEPWTRAWDGGSNHILMQQRYGGRSDWENHFNYLLNAFMDDRYIKINGQPIFVIYRSASIDRCDKMMDLWNELARKHGLPGIYFINMLNWFEKDRDSKFKAHIEFEPSYTLAHDMPGYWSIVRKLRKQLNTFAASHGSKAACLLDTIDYDLIWKRIIKRDHQDGHIYGAFVDWDNSARKGRDATILHGASPDKFEGYLKELVRKSEKNNNEFIFINAWNEWAEGAYLEPDTRFGFGYLGALKMAMKNK